MSYKETTVDWLLHLGASEELLRRAGALRRVMTEAERVLWNELRDRRLMGLKFRRQHPLHLYIADFYCHELRLAIEVDGGIHEHEDIREHDENRDAELERLGVTVLRFTNNDVMERTDIVLERIREVAEVINTPHPPIPSPTGEGEDEIPLSLRKGERGEVAEAINAPHPPTPSPTGEGEDEIPLSLRRGGRGEGAHNLTPILNHHKISLKMKNPATHSHRASLKLYLLLTAGFLCLAGISWGQTTVTYTASGTFTVPPAGVTSVNVETWGAGGGGGGIAGNQSRWGAAGGGGGGAYAKKINIAVVPGNSYTVTVGTGGTSGVAGTDSWFLNITTVLAKGGSAGVNVPNDAPGSSQAGGNGGLASQCIGDFVYSGGNGASGNYASLYGGGGGSSAGSSLDGTTATNATGGIAPQDGGDGGNGRATTSGVGSPGVIYGGGGGGALKLPGENPGQNGGNGANGTVVITYTVSAAPTITSFTPTSACAGTGTSVTITGTNFTGATAVTFYNGQSASYTVNTSTQITATLPSGATTGPISVTTPSGTGTSSTDFTVNVLPTFTVLDSDITCFNAGNGTITITVTGGAMPYEYRYKKDSGSFGSWTSFTDDDDDDVEIIGNLGPGVYTVEIRDANGCEQTECTVSGP